MLTLALARRSCFYVTVADFAELTKADQELLAEIRQKKMQLLLEIQVFITFGI